MVKIMKTLNIPEPTYIFTDGTKIKDSLQSYHATESRRGNTRRTLAGAYKLIRVMPKFAALGDYVILSACVEWMLKNDQPVKKTEIRRCLGYFQPALERWEKNEIMETFFRPGVKHLFDKDEANENPKKPRNMKNGQYIVSGI